MLSHIQITKLNDFIFCPRSLYFHGVYENFATKTYHDKPQKKGRLNHESIDQKTYSTSKKFVQSLPIYSKKYNLAGKIDIYDSEEKALIERKTRVKTIYDGYKYQLYAQYFCLIEMGFEVKKLLIHSLEDNKRYVIDLPIGEELKKFENLIEEIKNYDISNDKTKPNPEKCKNCIYSELCSF